MGIVAGQIFTQPEIGANYNGDGRTIRQIVTSLFSASAPLIIEIIGEGNAGKNGWSPVISVVTSGNNCFLRLVNWAGGTGTKPTIDTNNNYIGTTGLVAIGSAVNIRGLQGLAGNGIASSSYDSGNGKILLTFSDTTTFETGDLRGAQGVSIVNVIYDTVEQEMTITFSDESTSIISFPIPEGNSGWAPVFEADNTTTVGKYFLKIIDYVGGTGSKPNLPTDTNERFIGLTGYTNAASAFDFRGSIGPDGVGISSIAYDSGTGILTFTLTDATTYSTDDLRAPTSTINISDVVGLVTALGSKVNIADVKNTLTDTSTNKPLSALQGKNLKDLIDTLTATVGGKQPTITPISGYSGNMGTETRSDFNVNDFDPITGSKNIKDLASYFEAFIVDFKSLNILTN